MRKEKDQQKLLGRSLRKVSLGITLTEKEAAFLYANRERISSASEAIDSNTAAREVTYESDNSDSESSFTREVADTNDLRNTRVVPLSPASRSKLHEAEFAFEELPHSRTRAVSSMSYVTSPSEDSATLIEGFRVSRKVQHVMKELDAFGLATMKFEEKQEMQHKRTRSRSLNHLDEVDTLLVAAPDRLLPEVPETQSEKSPSSNKSQKSMPNSAFLIELFEQKDLEKEFSPTRDKKRTAVESVRAMNTGIEELIQQMKEQQLDPEMIFKAHELKKIGEQYLDDNGYLL